MANEKNLRPFTSEQSREEAKKNGAKGGVESGKSKRRKKSIKKTVEMVLNLGVDAVTGNTLTQLGVDESDQSIQTAIVVAQAVKAMRGDTKAATFITKHSESDERLKIERERLELEKKKIELQLAALEAGKNPDGVIDDVQIYLPDNGRNDDGDS